MTILKEVTHISFPDHSPKSETKDSHECIPNETPAHGTGAIRCISPASVYSSESNPLPSSNAEPRYVTADDWESKKGAIEELYIAQNLPLSQVTVILETEHGFKATERMYKRRFIKWGWHKYASKRWGQTSDKRPHQSRPTDRTGLSRKNYSPKASHTALTVPMMHGNDSARNMEAVVTAVRHYMLGLADKPEKPSWMITSKYDSPFCGTGSRNWANVYALPVYYGVRSAMSFFEQGDSLSGGRLLRRAFRVLDERLRVGRDGLVAPDGRDGPNGMASLVCSILVSLVSTGRTCVAATFLRFIASRVSLISLRHPLASFCKPLLNILSVEDDCRAAMKTCLTNIFKAESASVAELRGPEHRDRIYFWSQYDSPMRLIYDDTDTQLRVLSSDRVEQISAQYDEYLREAGVELGDLHTSYLFLECATVSFAARWGIQTEATIGRGETMVARLRKHYCYADQDLPIEAWRDEHQQAYIELLTFLWPMYLRAGQTDKAIAEARSLSYLRSSTFAALTGLWVSVDILVLQFESLLSKMGRTEDADYFKKWRLSSAYYVSLEQEFVAEEREFVQTRIM